MPSSPIASSARSSFSSVLVSFFGILEILFIVASLIRISPPCRNNTDQFLTFMIATAVSHKQNHGSVRDSNSFPTLFIVMSDLHAIHCSGIEEDAHRHLEADAMFLEVLFILVYVPLELHL